MKRILKLPNKDMAAASLFRFLNEFSGAAKRTPASGDYHCPLIAIELKGRQRNKYTCFMLFIP